MSIYVADVRTINSSFLTDYRLNIRTIIVQLKIQDSPVIVVENRLTKLLLTCLNIITKD